MTSGGTGGTREREAGDGRLVNVTTGSTLASDLTLALTSAQRRRGLIGRRNIGRGEALVFPGCRQVHTFGMLFTIDVLFLDGNGVVVKGCEGLRPGRLSPFVWRSRTAVELPSGTIADGNTTAGDLVEIEGLSWRETITR